ncbi:hypothetical protein [Flavobacterium sp.]|uniref:hypothetical protein n=1 Tax=Flavobacterium sp. TaxID=239 RepID=UPI0037538DD7
MVLFITFLLTPTIVTLIEKSTDVSIFYSFSEEEIHKDLKEIKADLSHTYEFVFLDLSQIKTSKIVSKSVSKHDNVADEIFSQPPELV